MECTIFYSWQSDLPGSTNRSFIKEALELAIQAIRQDDSITVEPRLDHDTVNVSGAPDIVQTILDKIDQAQIFVCDVSIINAETTDRKTPNPNVLVELGYAMGKVGLSRIIMVVNTVYGGPDELPFDLKTKRQTTYALLPGAEKAPVRKQLVGQFGTALRNMFAEIESDRLRIALTSSPVGLQFADVETHALLGKSIERESQVNILPDESEIPEVGGVGDYRNIQLYSINENYYKEFAEFLFYKSVLKPLRLVFFNTGSTLLQNVRLIVELPSEDVIIATDKDGYLEAPWYRRSIVTIHTPYLLTKTNLDIESRGNKSIISVDFGDVQPKARAISDIIYIGTKNTREVQLNGLIYGDQLSDPVNINLSIHFIATQVNWTVGKMVEIADQYKKRLE